MITIGVITNRQKDLYLKYTRILIEHIRDKSAKLCISADFAKELGENSTIPDEEGVINNSDVVICLGGDGTFLKVARMAFTTGVPILGINLGSLGFLTEIEKNDIENAVTRIVQGEYEIEERMMLEAVISNEGKVIANDIALNDIVVSRGALSRILHVKTYINNAFVDSFPGDGLIVSSPTGSTAYSLSCGGPIVEPDLDLMIVTPICPHILYSRSFITTGDRVVKAVIDESYGHEAMVTFDGQTGYAIHGGNCIEIKKAKSTVKLVKIGDRNFFNVLRTKIYDRGECLRQNEI